jgi:hypothetical protein
MGTRLTLADEREMLDEVRRWKLVPNREYERLLGEQFGTAYLDQLRAAAAETDGRRHALAGGPFRLRHHAAARPVELAPMLMAGVLRCLAASHCEHAPRADRPLVAVLAARVVACDACLDRFRGPIAAADERNASGVDRLCDFCLSEPEDNFFYPTAIPFGPTMVFGDMCRECQGRVRAEEAEH